MNGLPDLNFSEVLLLQPCRSDERSCDKALPADRAGADDGAGGEFNVVLLLVARAVNAAGV